MFAILLDCSEKTTCQAFDSGNTTLMANKIENGKAQITKTLLFFQPKCTGGEEEERGHGDCKTEEGEGGGGEREGVERSKDGEEGRATELEGGAW